MENGIFDNIEDWGRVLDRLEDLKRRGELEDHEPGLVRILRYRDNWRLREYVLEAARDLKRCSASLVAAVLDILRDEDLYYEVRVLAAEALPALVRARESAAGEGAPGERAAQQAGTQRSAGRQGEARDELSRSERKAIVEAIVETLKSLLGSSQVPVMHQAIRRVLPTIE
jgi:hypothetical protein